MMFCNTEKSKVAFSSGCTEPKPFYGAPEMCSAEMYTSAPAETLYAMMDTFIAVSIFLIAVLSVSVLSASVVFRLNIGAIGAFIIIGVPYIVKIGAIISAHDIEPDFTAICLV